MPISKVGQRQVVIPEDICEALGIETGDLVEVVQEGNTVVIKPTENDAAEVLSPDDEAAIEQGIADRERGDVRPWSQVKHNLGL